MCGLMSQYLVLNLLMLFCGLLASGEQTDNCDCKVPTPCKSEHGACVIPVISDPSRCEKAHRDCREVQKNEQALCSWKIHAKHGFCCWTACSSMRMKRTCGDAPGGFTFENTGERDGRECKHILNVREKCCLHENHIMGAIKPKERHCPKLGKDLAQIFETVDGNRASAPNKYMSATEVINSLTWLDNKGYIFLANNFSAIDVDSNHKLSWYELELFCGHRPQRLPPDDPLKVKPNEIMSLLSNPLLLIALLSSFVLGELYGIFQVMYNHLLGKSTQGTEGLAIRIVYAVISYVWPMTYSAFQIYYYIFKIQWEVCDFSKGWFGVKEQFIMWVGVSTVMNLRNTWLWIVRHLPTSPSKDLERRIFMQQVVFRQNPRWFEMLFIGGFGFLAVYTLNRAIFYGTVMDVDLPGLEKCRREDPDLALLYEVNEKFILWKVVQTSVIQLYIQLGWGIENKSEYTQLPTRETAGMPSSDYKGRLFELNRSERSNWEWFA